MKTNVFLVSLPRGPGNFHALESTHLWRDLSLASKHSWDPFLGHTGKMQVQGRISVRHVFQICAWQNAMLEVRSKFTMHRKCLENHNRRLSCTQN